MLRYVVSLIILVGLISLAPHTLAATVWTGPSVTFSKAGFADPGVAANRDQLTATVALTRASTQGMFNWLQEMSSGGNSPLGTTWATNINNPSQTVAATNFAALTFNAWATAYGGSGSLGTNILNRDAVVHLVADDIYLNLRFTAFGNTQAGSPFSYTRSTPVPEPTGIVLVIFGVCAAGTSRRTRC